MFVRQILSVVSAAVLAGVFTAGSVSAADCQSPCRYQKVVSYVCEEVPYEVCVTRYDHCGHPYQAHETRYRTVHVPVVKWIKACR